jgi:hypothetical protein
MSKILKSGLAASLLIVSTSADVESLIHNMKNVRTNNDVMDVTNEFLEMPKMEQFAFLDIVENKTCTNWKTLFMCQPTKKVVKITKGMLDRMTPEEKQEQAEKVREVFDNFMEMEPEFDEEAFTKKFMEMEPEFDEEAFTKKYYEANNDSMYTDNAQLGLFWDSLITNIGEQEEYYEANSMTEEEKLEMDKTITNEYLEKLYSNWIGGRMGEDYEYDQVEEYVDKLTASLVKTAELENDEENMYIQEEEDVIDNEIQYE